MTEGEKKNGVEITAADGDVQVKAIAGEGDNRGNELVY